MPGRPPFACVRWGLVGLAVLTAAPASADRLRLTTGRVMVVASAERDGDTWVVHLRSGGRARISASLVRDLRFIPEAAGDESPETVPGPAPGVEPASAVAVPAPDARPAWQGRPFADLFERAASVHGVDPALVHAVIQAESNYQPRARSPKGAKGLMQFMPDTARAYGLRNPYDPAANIDAGVRHLRSLLDRFELRLAVAAYNAGAGAVERARGLPPFAETSAYVARVLSLMGQEAAATR